jgi:calcium-dependent protein kinase
MLFDKPGSSTLKLADFGIATFISPGSKLESAMGTLTYIAPEVLKRKYDSQCDMWSAGVIMFILLSGNAPFKASTKKKTAKKISKGKYSLTRQSWMQVTEECKTFLSGLLKTDPGARLTPQQAFNSKWLQSSRLPNVSQTLLEQSANNLKRFMASHKFQKAVIRFITSQLLTDQDKKELDLVFKTVNKSGTGQVSSEEMIEYFKKYIDEQVDEQVMKMIFTRVDTDNNGVVDYSEFLAAAIGKKILCVEKLQATFNAIDSEKTGKISIDQLKSFLRTDEDIEVSAFQKLIDLVDKNHDGFIDFQEFQEMMEEVFPDESISK